MARCCSRDAGRSWNQEAGPAPPPTFQCPSSTFQWQSLTGSPLSVGEEPRSPSPASPRRVERPAGRAWSGETTGLPGPGAPGQCQTPYLVFWQAQQIQSSSFFW